MGAVCPSCETEVSNTYDCRNCGDAYCVDCRLPDDHDCDAEVEAEADGGTPAAGDMSDLSLSIPAGPKITAFVPVWRLLPWWVYAALAVVLIPLSTVILALQVYHERVTASEHAWRPSRVYYVPLMVFVIALLMSRPSLPGINTHWVVVAGFGYFWGLPATVIYAVQRRGR
ncbi:AN1-type zinc finger domain-containing protein [Halorientalis pallida]|uniref:AN1-type domain-containing protein n=1 Tax=Halorientalis pallida TaxID=2479928 RepID=A0A498L5J9_9EURY|nr:AN1-type zinc finger domain-containing protein [Halorientalis pallida]RXK51964.1 hypothetical protein EAF64_04845 [Halorientalis pallida]